RPGRTGPSWAGPTRLSWSRSYCRLLLRLVGTGPAGLVGVGPAGVVLAQEVDVGVLQGVGAEAVLHLLGRAAQRDPAVVDQADPVGALCLVDVVRGQEHGGPPLPPHPVDVVPQVVPGDGVQAL